MFLIFSRNIRHYKMNRNGLTPDALRQIGIMDKKLCAIQAEIRTFMNQKDLEITAIKSQIKELQGNKRPIVEEYEEKFGKKQKTECCASDLRYDGDWVMVYTDGACPNNGKGGARAGLGVWWNHGHKLNVSSRVKGDKQTNNVGEIQAIVRAIEVAATNDVKKLQINTDSEFTINSVTKWMPGWKKKGWRKADGKEVANKEDFIILDRVIQSKGGMEIKWQHVRGHAGIEGNEEADKLAVAGAMMEL